MSNITKNPKRVLHIVSSLSKRSGVLHVIMNYYTNIDRSKVQFDFLYYKDEKETFKIEINELGGRTIKIPKPKLGKKYKNELYKIISKIRKENMEIIHIHAPYQTFIYSGAAKKAGFKHVIVHSHATTYSDKTISKFRNYFVRKFFFDKYYDHGVACSKMAGDFLFGKNKDYYLLNNAINVEKFSFSNKERKEIRKEFNINENEIILGHIGRFANQKNHLFLLSTFKQLIKENKKKYKLLLVGTGPLENKAKIFVEKNKLENKVIFAGFRKDVDKILNALDIFVLPSLFEGLPIVAVEAQANGLPILLSDKITKEIGLKNYKYLPINDINVWVKAIKNTNVKVDRKDNMIIKEKNFSIKEESKKLLRYYLTL